MARYRAFIFDMNGTMINDMHYHEQAWYHVLVHQLKAPLTIEQVRQQIYGTSTEMFERIFGKDRFTQEEIDQISEEKEKRYREEFLPKLKLIAGLDSFLDRIQQAKIAMAIGTAAPVPNIDFVVNNLDLRSYFPVIIGPDDVARSKPDPEVFLKAAHRLAIAPENCIVFEDSPKGIEAAARAGMKAIGITSYHTAAELQNENILFTVEDYNSSLIKELL